jgi:hypothetical protein
LWRFLKKEDFEKEGSWERKEKQKKEGKKFFLVAAGGGVCSVCTFLDLA